MTVATFTAIEAKAISAAYAAIAGLCQRTNWSDAGELRAALASERKQAASDERQRATWAKAMVCKAWLEGTSAAATPASKLYYVRSGYLGALLLGVRHAIEREGDDYTGPFVAEAKRLCADAVAANEAHSRRIVEG